MTTNVLWFRSLHRIGASRATLVANLQPFVAAVFALVLLSEQMTLLQVLGGILIAAGILLARRRPPPAPASSRRLPRGGCGSPRERAIAERRKQQMDTWVWIVLAVIVLAAVAAVAAAVDAQAPVGAAS